MILKHLHPFWLPKAYVLTLAETPEREKVAMEHLNQDIGLSVTPYHGFHGKRMGLSSTKGVMTQGMIGCQLGHMSLWKTLQASKEDAFLIFEDDVRLQNNARWIMSKALWCELPSDWNVVFWGYCWKDTKNTESVSPSFDQALVPPMCFHAYMIKKRAVIDVLPKLNCDEPLDMQTRPLFQSLGGIYSFKDPMFARQRSLVYTEPEDPKVPVIAVDDGLFSSQTCNR